jgi:hypothetical protein
MVLCAYVDMLNLEDHMKGHKFFRQAAQLAIEVMKKKKLNKLIFFLSTRFIFVFTIIRSPIKIMTKMITLVN